MSPLSPFRVYAPEECGADGYPLAWHRNAGVPPDTFDGVKHLVREQAEHRCVRCGHPYIKGVGEWSPCDVHCTHYGPVRKVGDGYGEPRLVYDPVRPAGVLVGWGNHMQARWRILTVHHLRLGTDAKRDLRWWNLAALCQRCHLQIQGKVVMERIWPWPHSEWFQPYAAGWYAWSYLGEELTREQTMERLDELLALETVA